MLTIHDVRLCRGLFTAMMLLLRMAWPSAGVVFATSATPPLPQSTLTVIPIQPALHTSRLASRGTGFTTGSVRSNGSHRVYIPMAGKRANPNASPGGDTGALWLPFTTTVDDVVHTYGTNVAVDPAGGIHVTYAIWIGVDGDRRPGYYAYCPAHCATQANWTRVRLGDWVQDVRLALDPAGHPRLMLYLSYPEADNNSHPYQYAACDRDCTNAANWTITTVATALEIPAGRSDEINRYFALDGQGHPAFVYWDGTDGHSGSFYAYCTMACTVAGNWSDTLLSDEHFYIPSLTFTAAGQPRLAVQILRSDPTFEAKLAYIECDMVCAQWAGLQIADVSGWGSLSLRLNTNDRPRLAFYTGNINNSPLRPWQLYYAWCDSACTDADSNPWSGYRLGYDDNYGENVNLVLDRADRPRLASAMFGTGLGYAWCTANCESAHPTWQTRMVEASDSLNHDYPVVPIRRCSISTWNGGKRPSLALDAAGNPRFGYDAEHGTGGVDEHYRTCRTFTDITLARFVLINQP